MMFLQYFVQGCYLPIISVYVKDALGFTGQQIGYFGSALAVGTLVAPIVLGQLVDRHYATQYVLAFCHAAGGLTMLALYTQTEFWPVVALGTIYSIMYVPSLMLTNSLAFHHLRRSEEEFPRVRLWGTIGFIVPAWFVEFFWLRGVTGDELHAARGIVFLLAGVFGLAMALYAVTLPHTPPAASHASKSFAPAVVIGMLRRRDFAVLVLVTLIVSMAHKFFFVWNAPFLTAVLRNADIQGAYEQSISSIGQMSEVAVMAALGFIISRCGFKWTLVLGVAAYVLRCLVFALALGVPMSPAASLGLAVLGQALHGLCFACFLATGFMYVNRIAAPDIRGSMQNLFGTLVFSLGMFVGGFVAGDVGQFFTISGSGPTAVMDWPSIWLAGSSLAIVGGLILAIAFPRQMDDQQG